mgnify:CR=1 FL=1
MAVIKYKDLEARIARLKTGPVPPVCLIHGDTHLVRQACDTFCASVSEAWKGNPAIESLDGTRAGVTDIIDELTTFSFFSAQTRGCQKYSTISWQLPV